MPKTLSRRRILQGVVAFPIVDYAGLPNRAFAGDSRADELRSLWLRRKDLISRSSELDHLWLERRSQLPTWSLPGPKYRNRDGVQEGPVVGWPETKIAPVVDGDRWLLRPSPMDFRRLFIGEVSKHAELARALYRERMKMLRNRLRERRALISKVGLPTSSDWKPLETEIESIEQIILNLPVCPDTVAARLIITFRNRRIRSTREDRDEADLLKTFLHVYVTGQTPKLSGYILEEIRKDLEM